MEILFFIPVAFAVIVMPGPNVMVIVATTLVYGRRRGLQTVAGTSTAMLLQLAIAALGTSWLVSSLAQGFVWLKWCGVFYLVVLGLHLLLSRTHIEAPAPSALGSFHRGFWVSLTNPKTILFFSAFLPQFVSAAGNYLEQIAVLSGIFWLLAIALDSSYALLAAQLVRRLKGRTMSLAGRLSGFLYLSAGAALAAVKAP